MTRPIVRIHNIETDEVIDREMTAAEFKVYEADIKAKEASDAVIAEKVAEKQALLHRLGITADEAKLLLG